MLQKIKERDLLREELKEMTDAKSRADKENTLQKIQSRDQMEKMRDEKNEL